MFIITIVFLGLFVIRQIFDHRNVENNIIQGRKFRNFF